MSTLLMDLQAAIIAHLNWKSRLADFFYGLEELTPSQATDHANCDFGKWLYSVGLKDLAGFPEVDAMEVLHKEVHDDIRAMVAMSRESRMSDEGRQLLARFKEKCDRLVAILERMEEQVKRG